MSSVFDALFDAVAGALAFFYRLWPSYGGAIILLTLAVMVLMTPLTLKGTKSMMAMQRLQPEMKRIQERYKDDRERLNQELLAFYKENNINPVGGCLPLFLQMPVFIVLYRVISGLTLAGSDLGAATGWVSAQFGGEELAAPPSEVTERAFDPAYLDHTSELYRDLVGQFEMPFLGLDLAKSASQMLGEGVVDALPYLLLIAIVAGTGWYQQRQMQARSTGTPNPQQQMISRMMLFVLPAISFGLPTGVVLYFIVSNLYRVGQQFYITRTLYAGDRGDPIPAVGKGGKGSGGKGAGSKESGSKESGSKDKGAKGSAGKGGTPKGGDRKAGTKPVKPGRAGGGRVTPGKAGTRPGGSGAGANGRGGSRKTFTSDPSRKAGSGAVAPRPRKKKKQ